MKVLSPASLSCVFVLGATQLASACLSGEAIYHNEAVAHSWGNLGLALSLPVLCLQVWRRGFCASTIALLALITTLQLINPGLHYYGMRGDCGYSDVSGAALVAEFTGLLLIYQLAFVMWNVWLQKLILPGTPSQESAGL